MAGSIRLKFVVPNLITLIGLSFGLIAITRCLEQDFGSACWWIILCVLFDKLDGFAARALDAQSAFGVQMDSLSDMVTFCVTPAVLLLAVSRAGAASPSDSPWAQAGTLAAALVFAGTGALRLARFNVTPADADPANFQGFPTTFCGGTLALAYLVAARHGLLEAWLQLAPFVYGAFALLMVSNVPVPKFRRAKNPVLHALIVLNLAATYVFGVLRVLPEYMLTLVGLYVVFGGGSVWLSRLRGRGPEVS